MAQNIISPHDKLFKTSMSDLKVVRKFFNNHLPTPIKNIIDFSTIHPQKDSFVSDDLKWAC